MLRDDSYVIDFTESAVEAEFIEFWRDSIRWLIKNRDAITDDQCNHLLAWAMHMHTEDRLGRAAKFTWKGRTARASIQASNAYFDHVHRRNNPWIYHRWNSHGWNWEYSESIVDRKVVWTIRELISGIELFDEGQNMQHCVGGYSRSCVEGYSAIFSLTLDGQRSITIEVNAKTKDIVQARGKFNRLPTTKESEIIRLWSKTFAEKP